LAKQASESMDLAYLHYALHLCGAPLYTSCYSCICVIFNCTPRNKIE
jgi:hypothetical protein